jgi:hypothetical protein
MKVVRSILQNCGACGGAKPVIFRLDCPITTVLLEAFRINGFQEATHFTSAGMLYFDTPNLTITGPIGSDKITAKCKAKSGCDQILNDFEDLLTKM